MKNVIKAATVGASILLVATGCAAAEQGAREVAQVANPWQDDLRAEILADPEMEDTGEMCLGLTMFGIDTPEQIGALVFAFDEDDELPPASMTLDEWAAQEGESLPFSLPGDLTVREVANEAGAIMLDECGIDN